MTSSYERFASKECNVSVITEWTFQQILTTVKRRLTFREKYSNPWTVVLVETIHSSIFQAVRDHIVHHNITLNVQRNRSSGEGEKFSMVFKHLGELVFHLHKLSGISKAEVQSYFLKEGKNDRKAEVILSEEKPFTIKYIVKTSKMTISLYYEIKN